jgi:hypothetical protein
MNVDIFCFIVVFYVASLASPQIWKKKPCYALVGEWVFPQYGRFVNIIFVPALVTLQKKPT